MGVRARTLRVACYCSVLDCIETEAVGAALILPAISTPLKGLAEGPSAVALSSVVSTRRHVVRREGVIYAPWDLKTAMESNMRCRFHA